MTSKDLLKPFESPFQGILKSSLAILSCPGLPGVPPMRFLWFPGTPGEGLELEGLLKTSERPCNGIYKAFKGLVKAL